MTGFKYKIGLSESEFENIKEVLVKLNIEWELVTNPREKIINLAEANIGKPYKYGASVSKDAPNFFDCSSFTSWLYTQAGIALPRISIDQYVFGMPISKEELFPGDLIFSNSGNGMIRTETVEYLPGTPVPEGVDHAGIYLEENKVAHTTKKYGKVTINTLDEFDNISKIVGFRRLADIDKKRYVVNIPEGRADLRTKEDLINELERDFVVAKQ